MSKDFKPKAYNSVSPYFIVKNAQKLIDLLKEIFDAKETRCNSSSDGTIWHMEMQIDDSVIMLGEASEQFPPVPMVLHVYVPSVDVVFSKAIKAGCEVFEKPEQRDGDTDRRGTFIDFAGNMWSIATQLKNERQ
jgi:PhnB protein